MFEIRPAAGDDLDEIWALVRRAVAHARALGNPQWGDDYPTAAHFSNAIADGDLYAAVDGNGKILGVTGLNCTAEVNYDALTWSAVGPAMVIHKLTVDPDAQRQGIGSAFFRLAEELAGKQGVRSIRLDTYCLNARMQSLILKHGYRQVGCVHYPQRELPYPCYEKVLNTAAFIDIKPPDPAT